MGLEVQEFRVFTRSLTELGNEKSSFKKTTNWYYHTKKVRKHTKPRLKL
jgi:hypothetical protein